MCRYVYLVCGIKFILIHATDGQEAHFAEGGFLKCSAMNTVLFAAVVKS